MEYWENRHKKYQGSFRSVGHIGLTEDQNREDYETKKTVVRGVLREVSPTALWDAGAGAGHFLPLYADLDFNPLYASDISPTAISQIQAAFPHITTQIATVSKTRWWDFKMGAVVCLDVLYHVLDDVEWEASLINMKNHLEPGGVLLIQDHLENSESRPNDHIRYRTWGMYSKVLGNKATVHKYVLPQSGSWLDLMVWGDNFL